MNRRVLNIGDRVYLDLILISIGTESTALGNCQFLVDAIIKRRSTRMTIKRKRKMKYNDKIR